MDRNLFLALGLSFLVVTLWAYSTTPEAGPENTVPAIQEPTAVPADGLGTLPQPAPSDTAEALPDVAPFELDKSQPSEPGDSSEPEQRAELETRLYRSLWTTRGGGLLKWELTRYRTKRDKGSSGVSLVTTHLGVPLALATPLEGLGFGDLSTATYTLTQPDEQTLLFALERGGVRVTKEFRFEEDSYILAMRFAIENGGDRHIRPNFRVRWPVQQLDALDYQELSLAAWHDGSLETGTLGTGGGFLGIGGPLDGPVEYVGDVQWVGAQLRYFVSALLPAQPRDAAARFQPLAGGALGVADLAFRPVDLPPGQRVARDLRIYIGPKESERLNEIGAHLDEAIPKGWFAPLTNFFIWLLAVMHEVLPNYGVAIIAITILVRVLMVPILAKQMKSMKRMGELQPRMKAIQEKYGDDRQKQSEEMMKLYKETGFNPVAGCLPMILQLPVFIGLYYALQGAIELRHAPFVAWINDLSAPETLFVIPGLELPIRVLPLLMGGSMILQQSLTPMTTMDPAQAKMMKWMLPSVFTIMFYQFASGLVLYWLVSNVLGIAQQWYTNRQKAGS
ncbi:MAG: membrane protein insertase YidC [Myxococcales bacterium]|nr:membrane protein insertase YidC [Myxococcales bacterium]